MKNIVFQLMAVLLLLTAYSCSKESIEDSLLVGHWNVSSDSSVNTNKLYTLALGDSGVSTSNYSGEYCPASFIVDSNGIIVTSFFICNLSSPTVDSSKYVLTGNEITISIFAQNYGCCSFNFFNPLITRTYSISNLTANSATLTFSSGNTSPSGGASSMVSEVISLKK